MLYSAGFFRERPFKVIEYLLKFQIEHFYKKKNNGTLTFD